MRGYRAKHRHTLAKPEAGDVAIKLRGGPCVAAAVAGDGEAPRQICQCCKRSNKNIEAFARHHGTNREDMHDAIAISGCRCHDIVSRPCDCNLVLGNGIIRDQSLCRRRACHDHMFGGGQGCLFAGAQDAGLRFVKPCLQGKRVVHKAHQHVVRTQAARRFGQGAECKAVGDDGTAFRHHQQPRFGGGTGLLGGPGKVLAEIDVLHGPAEGFELGADAPVIGITAGRRGEITRHRKGELLYHKFASYDAHAT